MKQYSIRLYVALITLVPMVLIAVAMEWFFLDNSFSELNFHAVDRANLLASQLASSSEYGVVSNNQPFLQNLAQGILHQQDVQGVAILNSASQTLVQFGKLSEIENITHFSNNQETPNSQNPQVHYLGDSLLIFQPIIPQSVVLNEFDTTVAAKAIGAVILEINLGRIEKIKANKLWYTIVTTAMFLALTAYFLNLAVRRLVSPINKLSEAILTIGKGNLESRVSISTNMNEAIVLSNGINEMAEKLQHERDNLQQRIVNATIYIRSSQEKAEQANISKSKFLAAASHDLRQPIHAQGLFLDVLSRTSLSEQQQDLLLKARVASDASSEMINSLLDYSRIEAGVINIKQCAFNLQPLFHKIEKELAPMADKKGIIYRTRETNFVVYSDSTLVETILRNLISNAIHYTRQGGLLVDCRKRGNKCVIEVWDTGIGIAPEQQNEVFREFHQLGNPERNRNSGLGLGLAIAQGLAHALMEDITLSSTPKRGSVFRLTLPFDDTALSVEENEAPVNISNPLNARVLVIDDDETVRLGMSHLLNDWGCVCDSAESIAEAQELVREHTPDVMLTDYRLHEWSTGIDAIYAVRTQLGINLPVLLITGDNSSTLVKEAQNLGIPILHKPVSPKLLYAKLEELLRL
jgi:signal transduction histidine kinase